MTALPTKLAALPLGLALGMSSGAALADPPPGLALSARASPAPDAPTRVEAPSGDPYFPGAGHLSIAVASGVPFLGIAEGSVGATDWLTLGVSGGVVDTLDEATIGTRPRVAFYRGEHAMLMLSVPLLYYPPSKKRDGESWVLANPSLLAAARLPDGAIVYGGLGALFVSCTDGLVDRFGGAPAKPEDEMPMDGIWNTVHAGGTFPLSSRTHLFVDSLLILSGLEISRSYAHRVGVPAVAEAGVSAAF